MEHGFPVCAHQPMSLKVGRVPQATLGLAEATDGAQDMVATFILQGVQGNTRPGKLC